jgi:hypothetical protein
MKIAKNVFYYDDERNVYLTPYEVWKSKKPCYFYYHDDVLTKVDWKSEPTETLETLYHERAKQIRDDYEYVILCYSGGNDSSNVLETFYYNNIHIDEIVIVGSLSQDLSQEIDENHNKDLYYNAFPTLKSLNLPNTKVTFFDYTKLFYDLNEISLIKSYGAEYINYIGTHKSPHNLFWHDFRRYIGPNSTKKTAWIMGSEKVELNYGPYFVPFVYFTDSTINSYGMNHIDDNFHRVNFYNEAVPTAINIQKKQAHMLARLCECNPLKFDYRDRFLKNKLFYPKKHINLAYQSEKSKNTFLSVRDTFLIRKQNSDIFNLHKTGMISNSNYYRESHGWYSRPYYIR